MDDIDAKKNLPPQEKSWRSTAQELGNHSTFKADIKWDNDNHPVIYITLQGTIKYPREAISVIGRSVEMINASTFEHVCSVYNLLELSHLPALARFINVHSFPNSTKTAHIIVGTQNQTFQLIASLSAVIGSKRLRSMEVCSTDEGIQQAVKRWLGLTDQLQSLTITDL